MYLPTQDNGRRNSLTRSERNRIARRRHSRRVGLFVCLAGGAAAALISIPGWSQAVRFWQEQAWGALAPLAFQLQQWAPLAWWLVLLVPIALAATWIGVRLRTHRRSRGSPPRVRPAVVPEPDAQPTPPPAEVRPAQPDVQPAVVTSPREHDTTPISAPLEPSFTAEPAPAAEPPRAAPASFTPDAATTKSAPAMEPAVQAKPVPQSQASPWRSLFARSVLGIDVGNSQIKIVEVLHGQPPRLLKQAIVPTPRGSVENGIIRDPKSLHAAIVEATSIGDFSVRRAATTLTGQNLMLRKLNLPPMPRRELKAAIDWQIEQILQLSREDTLTDFNVMPTRPGEPTTAVIVAIQRAPIINFVDFMQSAGFEIVRVDIEPLAVFRAALLATESQVGKGTHLVCDFGGGTTNLSIFREGVLQTARVIQLGGNHMTHALVTEHPLSFSQAEAIKIAHGFKPGSAYFGSLLSVRDRLFGEIATTVNFFLAENKGAVLDSVQVVGGNSLLPHLAEQLEQNLRGVLRSDYHGFHVAFTNPITFMTHGVRAEELSWRGASLCVAIGLALGEV